MTHQKRTTDRVGTCVACGQAVERHFDPTNRMRGCDYARTDHVMSDRVFVLLKPPEAADLYRIDGVGVARYVGRRLTGEVRVSDSLATVAADDDAMILKVTVGPLRGKSFVVALPICDWCYRPFHRADGGVWFNGGLFCDESCRDAAKDSAF